MKLPTSDQEKQQQHFIKLPVTNRNKLVASAPMNIEMATHPKSTNQLGSLPGNFDSLQYLMSRPSCT